MCVRAHPLGAAPNFHACADKKDKSAHAHVGVHASLYLLTANLVHEISRPLTNSGLGHRQMHVLAQIKLINLFYINTQTFIIKLEYTSVDFDLEF